MRLLSLFSGIGAFEKALTNIGIDYELVGFSEIDKWAIESYCAIHSVEKELNLGDVSEIDTTHLKDIDIITHGSPCQDFSVAGHQKGGDKSSGTRSSLMWETVRIIEDVKPKYVVWENVKGVLNKNNRHNFEMYLDTLERLGYTNYYSVLNSKEFGVPQNRERVFVVSGLGYMNDPFNNIETTRALSMKSVLDLKSLPTKSISELANFKKRSVRSEVITHTFQSIVSVRKYPVDIKKLQHTLRLAKRNTGITNREIATLVNRKITTVEHWFRTDECFSIPDKDVWCDLKAILDIKDDSMDRSITTYEKRLGKFDMANRVYDIDGIAPTITASGKYIITDRHRFREMSSEEKMQLMGFTREDYFKSGQVSSDFQVAKQAGNSIVVPVLEEIFKQLFK